MCVSSFVRSFIHSFIYSFRGSVCFLVTVAESQYSCLSHFLLKKKSKHNEVPVYSRCNHDDVPGHSILPKLHLSSYVTVNFNI